LPTAEKRLTWRSDSLSPRVEVRYQIPGVGHPDRPQFDVLEKALQPHLQSVLSSAGVDASVDINTLVVHTTRFGVPASLNIEVTVENAAQTATAEALILDEIRKLSEEPLLEDDVALARKVLRTEWYRTAVNPNALAFEIGHFEVMDSWTSLAPYLEARDQTEAGDLTRLISRYFVARNRSVGVVIPEGAVQ
jgi:predicted Zn-dependent peptidase